MADSLTDFVTNHPALAASAIGALLTAASTLAGIIMRKIISAAKKAFETLDEIKTIQTQQAANHLTHIEEYTLAAKDEAVKTNIKLDTLIEIMGKKL